MIVVLLIWYLMTVVCSKLLANSRDQIYGTKEQQTIEPCIAEVHLPSR